MQWLDFSWLSSWKSKWPNGKCRNSTKGFRVYFPYHFQILPNSVSPICLGPLLRVLSMFCNIPGYWIPLETQWFHRYKWQNGKGRALFSRLGSLLTICNISSKFHPIASRGDPFVWNSSGLLPWGQFLILGYLEKKKIINWWEGDFKEPSEGL